MNTIKIYETESHVKEFDAIVIDCVEGSLLNAKKYSGKYMLELDRTAFFPEGGGQAPDKGTILNMEVMDVQEINGHIYHCVKSAITPGTEVHGCIDWDFRFSCMQNHSGEHIVSGLVHQHYGYENVGFHMGHDAITMDFSGPITPEQLTEIETEANQVVVSNVEIQIAFPSKEELADMEYRSKKELEGQVRIVTIPGVDICACCAPHVIKTGEIGMIKIMSSENYKGGTRVYMLCGFRWLEAARNGYAVLNRLSVSMSAKQDKIIEYYERQKNELNAAKMANTQLQNTLVEMRLESVKPDKKIILGIAGIDSNALRNMANELALRTEEFTFVYSWTEGSEGYRYILASQKADCGAINKAFAGTFTGKVRGGGKNRMAQGSFFAEAKEVEEFFRSYQIL